MHEVRVYRNRDRGTRWWAEDDLGFNGGADRLASLLAALLEWIDAEGIPRSSLAVRLKGSRA